MGGIRTTTAREGRENPDLISLREQPQNIKIYWTIKLGEEVGATAEQVPEEANRDRRGGNAQASASLRQT